MVVGTKVEGSASPEECYALKEGLRAAGFYPVPFEGREGVLVLYGEGGKELARGGYVVISVLRDRDLYRTPVSGDPRILDGIPFWGRSEPGKLWEVEKVGEGAYLRIRADVFGNLFQLLARPEEWGRAPFGPEGSFLRTRLDRPIGDRYIGVLRKAVEEACGAAGRPCTYVEFWPGGEPFAAFVSHDVDRVHKWTYKRVGYELIRALPIPGRVLKVIRSAAGSQDPYWNFERIMAIEEDFGVRSTFFFGTGRYERRDPSYELSQVEEALRKLVEGGWEVGLHASIGSCRDVLKLREEKEKLEAVVGKVYGVRQHFLRLAVPETWRVQDKVGFLYDATLGYSRREGFRAGTSLPFFPYDPGGKYEMNVLAIPLTIMDTTFTTFRRYSRSRATDVTRELLREVEESGGVFSALVHQSSLDEDEFPYVSALYVEILKEVKERKAYVARGMDIAKWWTGRANLREEEGVEEDVWCWRIYTEAELPGLCIKVGPGTWEVKGGGLQVLTLPDGMRVKLGPVPAGKVIFLCARRSG
ncbi:MAG TPA: hypothetical protein EYP61_08705 [Candidatus Latescibacteria bacterium]|nr:hypothetical protein [Candidatus Latescibacterota bacterium]